MRAPRSLKQASAFALLSAAAAGCATAELPSREGSTSERVVYAYFSTEEPRRQVDDSNFGTSVSTMSHPPRRTEFDPTRDDRAVFVIRVKPPKDVYQPSFEVRATLISPAGPVRDFVTNISTDRFRETESHWWWFSIPKQALQLRPGEWSVGLYLDGESVGTYRFLAGDVATLARIKEEQRLSAESVARMFAPQVRLEISGPVGADVKVQQSGVQASSGAIDATGKFGVNLPPGTYVVDVSKTGFEPWQETVVLGTQGGVVARAAALKAR